MTLSFKKTITLALVAVAVLAMVLPHAANAQDGGLLATVKARGNLICGVNGGLPGFGLIAPDGTVTGFDADFCRAVAAAIFGDANRVEFKPVAAADRWTALQSGEIDLLVRNSTHTLERDTIQGAEFGPVNFYDGQTFLVRKEDNLSTVADLNGATICVIKGTTTEANLSDIIASSGIQATIAPFDDINLVFEAFNAKSCQAVTSDGSQLAARAATDPNGSGWTIFAETFSREPLAPAWKAGDAAWGDLVRWVMYALIIAEDFGITSENYEAMAADADLPAEAKRMLDVEGEFYTYLGLEKGWAMAVLRSVGNYGEIYERNLGVLGLPRGNNALYKDGGLMYAPPFR